MYPTEGLNFLNDVGLGVIPAVPLYIGLFTANYTPVLGDIAASFSSTASETVAYNESTRPLFVVAASSGGVATNSLNKAIFTFNSTVTVYGAFISTSATKGGTNGKLIDVMRFVTADIYQNGSILNLTYNIGIQNP